MVQELLKFAISEKLSKQIMYKIPYLVLISYVLFLKKDLIINSLIFILRVLRLSFLISLMNLQVLKIIGILCFLAYLITSFILWKKFEKMEEELILLRDIKSFRKKLREIFEEGKSIFEDIKMGKLPFLFGASGVFFFFFLIIAFIFWFTSIHSPDLIVTVLLGSLIFVSYDIMKSDLLEESKEGARTFPFIEDVIEKYTLTNFLEKLPGRKIPKDILFKLLYRFFSPPLELPVPKITFDVLMVYKTEEVDELLKAYENKNTNRDFYLKHVDGISLEVIRRIDKKGKGVEKISLLIERSPLENFPYLFDPDYESKKKNGKKWSILEIVVEKTNEKNSKTKEKNSKILGYIIVHAFKGVFLKRKLKPKGDKVSSSSTYIEPRAVYFFIFIGLRDIISYIKKEIEFRAPKFNQSMINIEIEDP